MKTETPRSGIERRILTSILWFGILPLSFIFVSGYFFIRDWQRQLAEDFLLTALSKTLGTLRMTVEGRQETLYLLASAEEVQNALFQEQAPNEKSISPQKQKVEHMLQVITESSRLWSFAVLDKQKGPIYSPNANETEKSLIQKIPYSDSSEPALNVIYDSSSQQILVAVLLGLRERADSPLSTYVLAYANLQRLVEETLRTASQRDKKALEDYQYQILYPVENVCWSVQFLENSNTISPSDLRERLDPRLTKILNESSEHSGTFNLRLKDYSVNTKKKDVFAACGQIFENSPVYLLVCRAESDVFWNVNRAAAGMLTVAIIVIAFLYLNAYRNVHNNIVRNVLLLNEGAQIIGQGDLDLKLKIATGDEIEELAQSFNKMALALKKNIGRLEASEEKYRRLFTSMRDGMIQADLAEIIALANPAAAEILGFEKPENIIGKPLKSLFEESEQLANALEELRLRGFLERIRIWVTRKDYARICLEFSGSILTSDSGAELGFEVVYRDITKNVQLEHEARERAERISAINQIANVINSSLQAGRLYESLVVEVKKLVDFDTASIALLSETGDRFEIRQLWPDDSNAQRKSCSVTENHWAAPLVAREQRTLAIQDLTQPGEVHLNDFPENIRSCLCVPLHASGKILGTFNLGSLKPSAFTAHDVEIMEHIAPHVAVALRNAQLLENLQVSLEEVTKAQEKLREAHEELKTLDEMKTNLLSNVSHELRTPLVAVLGYTDMIYNGKAGPITEKQEEYLAISLRNIEKLVTLIENLLDFSRLHRGSETLVFDNFDLRDCVSSSMEIMRPVAESREITLELNAPEEPVLVRGDKGKLGQVFTNLLSNAVKFNHHGGSVVVTLELFGDSVEVRVTDTGIGIPPEAQEKVFTRFYQYDSSSTRKYGGAGIGLSIAQDIARLHGTKICVSSEVGKGSTFSLRLPLLKPERGTKEGEEDRRNVSQTRQLVEVISEDRSFVNQIRSLLEGEGIDVVVSSSPQHASFLAKRYSPDCAILDLENARITNEIAAGLQKIREQQSLPWVVFTSDDTLYEKFSSGLTARIKPGFRKSTLLSAIHYVLGYATKKRTADTNRILCVDDDPEVVEFISRSLEAEGYSVDWCQSGEEALERLSVGGYDVVLLDIAMPGLDGFETCRRIRAIPNAAGLKIFMVTAKPLDTVNVHIQEAGFDGFLWKPFRSKELVELIKGALGTNFSEAAPTSTT